MTGNEWGGAHLSCTGTLGKEYKVIISKPARKEPFASLNGSGWRSGNVAVLRQLVWAPELFVCRFGPQRMQDEELHLII
jgi:hypothetical protein